MAHNLVAQRFGMGIHIASESLADEHPNHIGRKHERAMLGIGSHNRLEEHVLPREGIELLVVRKALGNHGMCLTRNAFITKDATESTSATLHVILHMAIFVDGREVLVDHKGDVPL